MTGALIAVIVLVVVLLAVSAVFSAAETALTAASRARMHQLERDGDPAARRVNTLIERQERLIGSVLLGNNLLNILISSLTTAFLTRSIPGAAGVAIATAVVTALVLVFAEVLPKTLAIARPDDVSRWLSAPAQVVTDVFGPVIGAVQALIKLLFRLVGVNMDATQVMVHRTSIAMIDADLPAREVIAQALEAPHTRLPLYRGETENVVGVLHAKDLARAMEAAGGAIDAIDIAAIATPPWFIPDTTNLKDQLSAFLKRRNHFALIVDEYGALRGLVTLEDILEEIVGEIEDEHDFAVEGLRRQPDGSINVDGSVAIRDLNRALDWDLPDDDWVTVAGLIIHEAQMIPEPGQTFIFHGHRFQVLRRQRNQLTALRVSAPLAGEGS
jgi:Mg2+/Co2+ transporter CorB